MAIPFQIRNKLSLFVNVSLVIWVIVSVCVGQFLAPMIFSTIGKGEDTELHYLRAIVKLGDAYLIRNTFHDELVKSYPVVLDTYLKENTLLQNLQEIELRAPMSRDVLVLQAVLYKRMGDKEKYKEYTSRIHVLDPSHVLP